MHVGLKQDKGQAFPIYVVVVAGLLFAAFAFFAVGMASATRSTAQGAADAAALAAATDARDHLKPGLSLGLLKREDWEKLLRGELLDLEGACGAARALAADNRASLESCSVVLPRFEASVKTDKAVGESVVPGTSTMHGTADAAAVIEPRCQLGDDPVDPGDGDDPPPGDDDDKPKPFDLKCKGGDVTFDPLNPDPWRELAKLLFSVRLVD
ncbi:pilus assembly protein TadG-related protein [Streptomyces sp. NPDC086023]|uniref:pilus assembly protein TadG-related protein n=1 Tax=Streptomyces sp. NPDC086023 TaxID=3365746 RepID=UPI0037CFDCA8